MNKTESGIGGGGEGASVQQGKSSPAGRGEGGGTAASQNTWFSAMAGPMLLHLSFAFCMSLRPTSFRVPWQCGQWFQW